MSWASDEPLRTVDADVEKRLRIGAVGALGAVTLMWLARLEPMLFPLGTVALTMSIVPLAAGFQARTGLLLGLMFGVLWAAARLEFTGLADMTVLLTPVNAVSVFSMVALGALSGAFFGLPRRSQEMRTTRQVAPLSGTDASVPVEARGAWRDEDEVRKALEWHREWMIEWGQQEEPWVSFDNHVRELLRALTGARRVRCYQVDGTGEFQPLNGAHIEQGAASVPENGLLAHVVTTGRRFLARSPDAGEMIRELAAGSEASHAWVVPIRNRHRTFGLITVGGFEDDSVRAERLGLAADMIEEFWLHLQQAEGMRIAYLTDRPSGVLNRVEVLSILDQTVEQCYADNEPVVMLTLVIEGIRGMDDGGHWESRNDVIEIVGQTMRSRLRRDDIVGRFSDDRFVAVLRRLDLPLAHLITRKILRATEAELSRRLPEMSLTLRAGLAGGGFEQVPPQVLLLNGFAAINEARAGGLTLLPYAGSAVSAGERA